MLPPIALTISEVRAAVAAARRESKSIGFVPTMGALHAGHAALIRAAGISCQFTVVSIFVNPTQFGPNEDYTRYPRTVEDDRSLCGAVGADVLFVPAASEMYPDGFATSIDVRGLGDHLCGSSRPGHFAGVATVVAKLFNIVAPDAAFFGQKDAQQARIIQQMSGDLNFSLRVEILPTVREPDGLAMSSRNRYLDPTQRRHATVLHRVLEAVHALVASGEHDVTALERFMNGEVASTPGAEVDYARVVDGRTLQPIERIERPALAALAVRFGSTRLIDNVTLAP